MNMNRIGPIIDRIADSNRLLILVFIIILGLSLLMGIYAVVLFIGISILMYSYIRWSINQEAAEEESELHETSQNHLQQMQNRNHA